MIVKCSQCAGLSRVDGAGLSSSMESRLRCPHCNAVGDLQVALGLDQELQPGEDTIALTGRMEISPKLADARNTSEFPSQGARRDSDPTLPEEAFQSFPGRSSGNKRAFGAKRIAVGSRLLLWAGLSLAIVIFFALLVNLVLPGPTGGGFVTGTSRQNPIQKR